ncbi:MAG: TrkH family potassium uptake protein [Fidelibacterota bacterium]|nr:MAG: TrkH family potassium uptake protein [Candidatus Neomarinimicrobiota bacterium]
MLLSAAWAWYYRDGDLPAILGSVAICVGFGVPGYLLTRGRYNLTSRDGFAIVTLGWATMALFATLPFLLSGAITSFTDAFFEAMSGLTTTGATILGDVGRHPHLPLGIESMPHGILFWRAFIQWIGGMGIIMFSVAILPFMGMGGTALLRAEVPGPTVDRIQPRIRQTAKTLWLTYAIISATEAFLLRIGGMSWFSSLTHTCTTMATGGFSIYNDSFNSQTPYIQYVIIFFMLMAGINFTLHGKLIMNRENHYKGNREFLFFLSVIGFFTLLLFISNSLHSYGWGEYSLRHSLFIATSITTTTGYGTVDYETWAPSAQMLVFALFFVGGSAGSTGGSIKVIRILVVLKYVVAEVRKLIHPHAVIPVKIGEHTIPDDLIRNTLGFLVFYLGIFLVVALAVSFFQVDMVTAFSASASALGNIGPAFGLVGPYDHYGWLADGAKWILSFAMLLGRLEIFTVMVLFSRMFWK